MKCAATIKNGNVCSRNAIDNSTYCTQHHKLLVLEKRCCEREREKRRKEKR